MKQLIFLILSIFLAASAQAREFYKAEFKMKLFHSGHHFDSRQIGETFKGKVFSADDGAFPQVEINGRQVEAGGISISKDGLSYAAYFKLSPAVLKDLLDDMNSSMKDRRRAQVSALIAESISLMTDDVSFWVQVRCRRIGRGRGSRTVCQGQENVLPLNSQTLPEALRLKLQFKKSLNVR